MFLSTGWHRQNWDEARVHGTRHPCPHPWHGFITCTTPVWLWLDTLTILDSFVTFSFSVKIFIVWKRHISRDYECKGLRHFSTYLIVAKDVFWQTLLSHTLQEFNISPWNLSIILWQWCRLPRLEFITVICLSPYLYHLVAFFKHWLKIMLKAERDRLSSADR